jgi:eukaryotic-like serine/threonine-protein kinase
MFDGRPTPVPGSPDDSDAATPLPCPNDATLTSFLNDELDEDLLAECGFHIDACHACQLRMDDLSRASTTRIAKRYKTTGQPKYVVTEDDPEPPPDDVTRIGLKATFRSQKGNVIVVPMVPGFEVEKELGRGGMGVVYKAKHTILNRSVALKMVLSGAAADQVVMQRFLFEGEALARVQHPQVVQVYEIDMYQGPGGVPVPYLAMELLEGGSLADDLKAKGPLSPTDAAVLIEGLARAVNSAHIQGIIHRDIKPSNILKSTDGIYKVTDFGLAKLAATESDMTGSGMIVGTPAYMAPEQASGGKKIGPASDVYSLGALLFELVAGHPPFPGSEPMTILMKVINDIPPDLGSLRRGVPRDLAAVVRKCLEKEPERRYPSADALADDLRRFIENRSTRARPLTTTEKVSRWIGRNPVVAGLIFSLLAVTLTGLFVSLDQWQRAESRALRATNSEKTTKLALIEATSQKNAAELSRASLQFDRAVNWCEHGETQRGLQEFAAVLESTRRIQESEKTRGDQSLLARAEALERITRINVAAWRKQAPNQLLNFTEDFSGRYIGMALSRDRSKIYICGDDKSLTLWDLTTGKKLCEYTHSLSHMSYRTPVNTKIFGKFEFKQSLPVPHLAFSVKSVAVSPDETILATSADDGQIWLFDPEKTVSIGSIDIGKGSGNELWHIAFAADGTLWAAGSDGHLSHWDPKTRKPLHTYSKIDRNHVFLQVRPLKDGKRIITGDRSLRVRIVDVETGTALREHTTRGWVRSIAVSDGERYYAYTGTDGMVVVRDLETGTVVFELSLNGAYGATLAFRGDRYLLVGDEGGEIRIWDLTRQSQASATLRFSKAPVEAAFLNDGRFAVIDRNRGAVWQPSVDSASVLFGSRDAPVRGLDVSADGSEILLSCGIFHAIYDAKTAAVRQRWLAGSESLCAYFLSDGAGVVRGDRRGWGVLLRDRPQELSYPIASGQYISTLIPRPGRDEILFPASGTWIRSRQNGQRSKNRFETRIGNRIFPTNRVVFDATGTRAGISSGEEVLIVDADSGEPLSPVIRPGSAINHFALDRTAGRIVTGHIDGTAQVWDAKTGLPIGLPLRHDLSVSHVAIHPEGKIVLTGSRDHTARFWDADTGLPLGPMLRDAGPITRVVYSPTGDYVVTGTWTGAVTKWAVPPPPYTGTPDDILNDLGLPNPEPNP